jgi:peroxiredoxin
MRWQTNSLENKQAKPKRLLFSSARLYRTALSIGAALAFVAALALIIITGLPERADFTGQVIPGQLPIAPEINAIAPPFVRPDRNGQIIRLSDFRGTWVIINFWATWCEPCRVEMPILQAIYEARKSEGLRILAVNLGEAPNTIRDWQTTLGLTYDMLVDERQVVAALYHLRGQPSTYVVSPNGIITHIFYGPASESALTAALGALRTE